MAVGDQINSLAEAARYGAVFITAGAPIRSGGKALTQVGSAGGAVVQWSEGNPSTAGLERIWRVQQTGDGYYGIYAYGRNELLTVAQEPFDGVGGFDGAPLISMYPQDLAPPDETGYQLHVPRSNQMWADAPHPAGGRKLTAKHSGMVLDVTGASTGDGTSVIQWPWTSAKNQSWYLAEAPNYPT